MRRIEIDPTELAALAVLRGARVASGRIAALRCNDLQPLATKVRVIVGRRVQRSGVVDVHAVFIPRQLAAPLLALLGTRRGAGEKNARLFGVDSGAALRMRFHRGRKER